MNEEQDVAISDLDISGRSVKALARGGIRTVSQLVEQTAWDLTDLRGFGNECLRETVNALAGMGLTLKSSDFRPRS